MCFAEGHVHFSQRPKVAPAPAVPPEKLEAATSLAAPVTDDGLRTALERLARNVLTKSQH